MIEGTDDRRLAVELDGDSYHGPDKWVSDLYRQRALERVGWKFWRCWGSHWRADENGCFQELLTTLARMGIDPVGGEFSPIVYTEHRVVDRPEEATDAQSAPIHSDAAAGTERTTDTGVDPGQASSAVCRGSGPSICHPGSIHVRESGDGACRAC